MMKKPIVPALAFLLVWCGAASDAAEKSDAANLRPTKTSLAVPLSAATQPTQSMKDGTPKEIPESELQALLNTSRRDKVNRVILQYQETIAKNDALMREANVAFEQGRYEEARDLYIRVKNDLSAAHAARPLEAFSRRIEATTLQINRCYRRTAEEAARRADGAAEVSAYDEAIKLCREAMAMDPECRPAMEAKIKDFEQRRARVAARNAAKPENIVPDQGDREYQIQILMQRGREMAARGDYLQAREYYQKVLAIDPYRADATQNLTVMNIRITRIGEDRELVNHNRDIIRNRLEWLIPLPTEDKQQGGALTQAVEIEKGELSPLEKKLDSIIVPDLQMDETGIGTAVRYLQNQSKQHDPDKIGVNIFLRRNNEDGTENTAITSRKVQIQGENKSLRQALDLLCQATDGLIRWRLDRNAVIVESKDTRAEHVETKIFPIDPDIIKNCGTDENKLKEYFINSGNIPFPAGSGAVYDERSSRVIVTNTPENLRKLEVYLNSVMSEQDPLVQLQVRLIKINQTDLKSLSFNYSLSDNSSQPAIASMNTDNQLGYLDPAKSLSGGSVTLGDYELSVALNAVNQVASTDVLASPRVLTMPDQTVNLNYVREITFVEDYDDAEDEITKGAEGNQDAYSYIGPFPNFESTPTAIGIQLKLKPQVDKASRTIQMQLNPSYTDLIGWYEYKGTTDTGSETSMRVPQIGVYQASTNVTIADGETVVLGGIINDTNVNSVKKVPFIGDIPFLGRFFQSRSVDSKKDTLLIFITPTLVKPDGTPYISNSSRGARGSVSLY